MKHTGISVSDRTVRFITLGSGLGKDFHIVKHGEVPLPEGIVSLGTINDKATFTNAIKKLSAEHGLVSASIALPEEKAYLFTTVIEQVPNKDLHDVVAFTIEENVPVSLAKSVFSFETLELDKKLKAAITVLPSEVVEGYTESFKLAGIQPLSFDTEPQAVTRALVETGDKRSHLVINLSERKAGFYVVESEMVQFSSTLSIDLMSTSPETINTLKTEIRKFFLFWETKLGEAETTGKKIERVILSGPLAANESLTSKLMSEVDIPYVLGNVWTNVFTFQKNLPDISFETSLAYVAAIGAALPSRDPAPYKLLTLAERELVAKRGSHKQTIIAVSLVSVIVISFLFILTMVL